ncbi:MAG TPA: CvpA family protein [Sulfurovum sp.]|nr:CvpA family protein [Sulfurovum sp.]
MENFSMMDFNYFDVSISAIILILGIKGFMQGFIKEVFGLAGLIGGVYFASRLSDKAAQFIETNFFQLENTSLLKLIGFLSILIMIWLGATILGSIFSKLTSDSGLGFLNRLFGFIAGGGKYFLIFALIVTALSNVKLVKDNLSKYVNDSVLYPFLLEAGSYLIKIDTSDLGITTSDAKTEKKTESTPADINVSSTDTNITVEHNATAQ